MICNLFNTHRGWPLQSRRLLFIQVAYVNGVKICTDSIVYMKVPGLCRQRDTGNSKHGDFGKGILATPCQNELRNKYPRGCCRERHPTATFELGGFFLDPLQDMQLLGTVWSYISVVVQREFLLLYQYKLQAPTFANHGRLQVYELKDQDTQQQQYLYYTWCRCRAIIIQ